MRTLTFFFLFATFFAQAQSKIDPWLLNEFQSRDEVGFIVLMKEQADLSFVDKRLPKEVKGQLVYDALRQKAEQTQGRVRAIIEQSGKRMRPFLVANAVYAKGSLELVRQLAELPEVKTIMYDTPVKVEDPVSMEYIYPGTALDRSDEPTWGIKMIKADSVWLVMNIKGQGVVVGGQDTGYDWEHPAIKNRYRGNGPTPDHNYNWHDAIHEASPANPDSIPNPCGYDVPYPCDDNSHGTHTMGTMVGSAPDNVIGVAPEAQWIGCRNMERGIGTPASYIECFEFFLAPTDLDGNNPDVTKAPDVINNSWACPPSEGCNPSNFEVMNTVINNLTTAGILVVVSAGNSGYLGCGSVSSPAAIFENSFSIGSTALTDTINFNDSISSFSSRGPVTVDSSFRMKPDVTAPGQFVKSCVPNGGYAYYSGTSMAGPHTVGTAALMISSNPVVKGRPDILTLILRQTADPKMAVDTCGNVPGTQIPNNTYGYGRINAYKATGMAILIENTSEQTTAGKLMQLSPNPATGKVEVLILKNKPGAMLSITNSLGQIVKNQLAEFPVTRLDVSNLPQGIYFVTLRDKAYLETAKLIIRR